jgi:hypothetical protein
MKTTLPLGIAALTLLAGASASAGDLVNRGGTSDVPTYSGRVYYIKPAGASCPTGFTCFCNSGTSCTLPSSPTVITGTIIVDRPGVTLDCQDRWIQAPRFGGTSQQCTQSSDCGTHSSGAQHACVNGYCQLNGLGGINIGGPLGVDQGSINIDVDATGYVQDVDIRNCNVKSHYDGYEVKAFNGNDGDDQLKIYTSEFRNNYVGVDVRIADDTYLYGNYVHDNYDFGMNLENNWSFLLSVNTVVSNADGEVYFHGDSSIATRWLNLQANDIESTALPAQYDTGYGTIVVSELVGTPEATCAGDTELCDLRMESNIVSSRANMSELHLYNSFWSPSTVLRSNEMSQFNSYADVLEEDNFYNDPRCWTKNNSCNHGAGWGSCSNWQRPNPFISSPCWN